MSLPPQPRHGTARRYTALMPRPARSATSAMSHEGYSPDDDVDGSVARAGTTGGGQHLMTPNGASKRQQTAANGRPTPTPNHSLMAE